MSQLTCEHSLELIGVLETASFLQLGDHARFGLFRCRYTMDKSLGKLGAIESLEHILILDVLEDDHLRI